MTPEVSPAPLTPVPQPNLFPYGWRDVKRLLEDGTETWECLPLTLEDVLHPLEGDVIPEHTYHDLERNYLADVCRARLAGQRGALVLSDCLIDVPGQRAISPDLAVLFDVADPDRRRGTFYVAEERTHPVLALEIVSPDTRLNDVVRKVPLFERMGVDQYVIVDQERDDGPRTLLNYHLGVAGYQLEQPDLEGRVLLAAVGVLLELRDNRVACLDAVTGELLGDYTQLAQELAASRAARQEAEERARQEAAAREAAEQQAREEAAARQTAERQAREEVAARVRETSAREAAERQAREEAAARVLETAARQTAEQRAVAAEERLRQLEEELRRLRSRNGGGEAPATGSPQPPQ